MKDIRRRINNAEKQMSIGQHKEPIQPPMVLSVRSKSEIMAEGQDDLEPVDTWITYQEQLQAGQRANAEFLKDNPYSLPKIIVIALDVDEEYQARLSHAAQP